VGFPNPGWGLHRVRRSSAKKKRKLTIWRFIARYGDKIGCEGRRIDMTVVRSARSLLLLVCPILLNAQEVKTIDLSIVSQRTDLRYPPAPPCKNGVCGGEGGGSVTDGAPDIRDPHALGVYLLGVSPQAINPSEPFDVDMRIVNTGLAPIEVPVSPHLSDLQPADESVPFTYFSITLVVSVEGDWQHPAFAVADLYGAKDHDGTILVLRPGEWTHVKAKVKPRYSPSASETSRLLGGFWLRRNTFIPHAGGGFTKMENLYPNVTRTQSILVRFVGQPEHTSH
jgi:hypothetical protein